MSEITNRGQQGLSYKVYLDGKPVEIERKWLISFPDIKILEKQENYSVSSIEQLYITGNENSVGDRLRKRDYGDHIKYYWTHKDNINGISRFEYEKEILSEEYERLSKKIRQNTSIIRKMRHTFKYNTQIVEIDIYEFWNDVATMEIELKSEEQQIFIPEFIEVIKEVTGDKDYSNFGLACKY